MLPMTGVTTAIQIVVCSGTVASPYCAVVYRGKAAEFMWSGCVCVQRHWSCAGTHQDVCAEESYTTSRKAQNHHPR